MMRGHVIMRGSRLSIEVEAADQRALFEAIAEAQDVFDADTSCGHCGDDELRFRVRHHGENRFYELYCSNCAAILQYGQHRARPTLFPKRTDDAGAPLSHRGWKKWNPTTKDPDHPTPDARRSKNSAPESSR